MDDSTKQILKEAGDHIAETKATLEKQAAQAQAFQKEGQATATLLTDYGILPKSRHEDFLAKLAEDPSSVFGVVRKLAGMVQKQQLGSGAPGLGKVSSAEADPYVAAFAPEYVNNGGTGMVD
jgi:hypothetical protein